MKNNNYERRKKGVKDVSKVLITSTLEIGADTEKMDGVLSALERELDVIGHDKSLLYVLFDYVRDIKNQLGILDNIHGYIIRQNNKEGASWQA